jgi:hypothetical protein
MPAPRCLAARVAPSRCAIDAAHRALAPFAHSRSLISEQGRAPLRAALPLPWCVRPRARLATDTSDAPCRAPRAPGKPEPLSENQDRFPRLRVNEDGYFGPERLPSTSALGVAPLARSRSLGESPPPVSRLCHRDPASDALSPLLMLSHGAARPTDVCRRLFARGREGPRAACRLLQSERSASTTLDEPTEPRAPHRWSPTCTALPAGGYAGSGDELPFGRCLRSAASREVTGQGPRRGCSRIRIRSAPPITIARNGSFAPTRSARTPLVAGS